MSALHHSHGQQLGFGELLREADADNKRRRFERETAHLPGSIGEGLACYRAMIQRHHTSMMDADVEGVRAIREEARLLALKLNNGKPGIRANDDAPGCTLARETRSKNGAVPDWGQEGSFVIDHEGMLVEIEMQGLFGIGSLCHWLGFAARAVDSNKLFISETGYRSFLGASIEFAKDITPDRFAAIVIGAHVADELRGKLVSVAEPYLQRLNDDADRIQE